MKSIHCWIAPVILAVALGACSKKDEIVAKPIRVTPIGGADANSNASSRNAPTVASNQSLARTWVRTLNINAELQQAFENSHFVGGICAQIVERAGINVVEVSSAAQNCAPDALNTVNEDQIYVLELTSLFLASGQSSTMGILNSDETELVDLCSGGFVDACHFLSEVTGEFAGIVVDR